MAFLASFIGAIARAAVTAGVVALAFAANAAEEDKGVLANLISKALSSPSTSVSIGAVDGALSSNASIRDIVLSDRDGPWLKVDRVRLIWNRLALLKRRVEVEQLTIEHLQFLRRPIAAESEPASDATSSAPDALTLPELPVKVIIKQFAVQELFLGASIAGGEARLSIGGKATLGPPSEGLDLHLEAHRLDAAGVFTALLGFVPATKILTLNLALDEPAGGLAARIANIPGAPPVTLSFGGSGPLDAFKAKLDFSAGPRIGASGQVDLARIGLARRLSLDLKSRLEGLMPGVVAPIFAGETSLEGEMSIHDDSSFSIPGLHLVSASARLDIEGGASADQQLDLKVHAGAIPGDEKIGKLDFNAAITGPLAGPKLDSAFDAGQIKLAFGTLGHVTAAFTAAPDGSLSDATTRIALTGRADVEGLALAEPALDQAIGASVKLTLRGVSTPLGAVTVDVLNLGTPALDASYSGLLSASKIQGKLKLEAADLSRFAELAGSPLAGDAQINADLDGAPRSGALAATLDGRATHFASGHSVPDRIIGGQLALSGVARSLSGGGFGFDNLVAAGAHGSARLDGAMGRNKVDLNASIDIAQGRFLDPAISGAAQIAAALTGALDHLDANLKASLGDGRLLDRPTTGLTLEAHATDITGMLAARASLTGNIDHQPLTGSANLSRRTDGGWAASDIGLRLGSAHLAGELTLDADQIADGAVSFGATNLDDLSPLVLTRLSGSVRASARLAKADNRQDAALSIASDKLAIGANVLSGLDVDLSVRDVWGAKIVSGIASIAGASLAGQSIGAVKLAAKGGADSSDLDFSGSALGMTVAASGTMSAAKSVRLDLARMSARGNGQSLALATPATLMFDREGVEINSLVVAVGGGRLTLSGRAGPTLDLRTSLAAIPLSAADLVARGLGLSGVADGEATIGGTLAEPSGDWRLHLKGLSAPQSRGAGLPPFDIAGSGRLGGNRTSLDISVGAGAGNALRLTGYAPLASDGDFDVRIAGRLDAGLANNTLSVSGRRVAGAAMVNVLVRGPVGRPQARGSVTLSNGSFSDEENGLRLAAIDMRISMNGDTLTLERFHGATPNGGAISASGQVRLDPAAGFPGSIHLSGQHAQLVSTDVVAATADLTLDVTGALAQAPHIAGRVAIVSMDINVPENFSGVAAPIPGTRHVNPNATARARLALDSKAKSGRVSGRAFNATLAMTISAPNRVFVRGRGINAELSGDLRVNGAAANPQISGGFDLRRGSLSLLGKRLEFTRGRVQFTGDAMPELNLQAETSAGDVTARIGVTGPASRPVFAFTSDPSLPQDEILSRVLFQKASGNLSPFQALQLANAVASLTGRGDAFERLRRSLGVDSLDIGSSATGGPTVGVSRAINDRISVGVKTGAKPADSGVSVDLDVTRHIRLQAGVDATGGSDVGVGAEWEY